MRGVPMRAAQKLADHADLRMTERYSHLSERALGEAVAALPVLPANGNGHAGRIDALAGWKWPRLVFATLAGPPDRRGAGDEAGHRLGHASGRFQGGPPS